MSRLHGVPAIFDGSTTLPISSGHSELFVEPDIATCVMQICMRDVPYVFSLPYLVDEVQQLRRC